MTSEGDYNEERLIRYFLGDLTAAERNLIEDRFFDNDRLFEEMKVVEQELIDRYVKGELSPPERKQFRSAYLNSPARRKRVEFALALAKAAGEQPVPARPTVHEKITLASPKKPRGWFFKNHLLAASLLTILILILVNGWLVYKTSHLQTQIDRLQEERASSQHRREEEQAAAEQPPANNNQPDKSNTEQAERGRDTHPNLTPAPPVPSVTLSPLTVRGQGEVPTLRMTARDGLVRLVIQLEPDDYRTHRATIKNPEEKVIWQGPLKTTRSAGGKAAILILPARLFATGNYELAVNGIAATGSGELVGSYSFNVIR